MPGPSDKFGEAISRAFKTMTKTTERRQNMIARLQGNPAELIEVLRDLNNETN